jgi:DNA-binding NarL/FixJ family response regulator
MVLSVVLAEDNLLVREGVVALLSATPDIRVAASCADADALRRAIDEHVPDVVVTDIRMPPLLADDGVRVAIELRRQRPTIGVVVLSSRDDPEYALALMAGGTAGRAYLLKERIAQPGELLHAVREVAAGRSVVDQQVVQRLLQAGRPTGSPLGRLSPRETEVLGAMAEGANNAVIADRLFLTVRGVERHINSIFAKLDLTGDQDYHHRVRAVLLYLAEH